MTHHSMRSQVLAGVLLAFFVPALHAQDTVTGRPQFRLQRIVSLGGDLAPEREAFSDIAGIAVSTRGVLYVLDAGNRAVHAFDRTGRFIGRFGRRGSGPAEFQDPATIWVDSVVNVADMTQHRLAQFTLDGQHLRTMPLPTAGDVPLLKVRMLRNGLYVGETLGRIRITAEGVDLQSLRSAVVVLSQTSAVDTLAWFETSAAPYHPRDAFVPFGLHPTHVGNGGGYAILGDSVVAIADGHRGVVRWYRADGHRLVAVRTRQLPSRSRPLDAADRSRIAREIREKNSSLPRQLVIGYPDRISVASYAVFSDDGHLWIRNTAEPGQAHVWTVYDAAGALAYRLSLPPGFDLSYVRGDVLYGTARTPNDAPLVQVYRLIR
jgi:hypothetical protein